MTNFEFSVPCLFGLEGIAGDELRRLDMENVRVENGRVLFSGDGRAMAKANVCLRTGERVLIVLADFPAKTFEELFQGVCRCNLEDYIPKDGAFPVKGHCLNSTLMSGPDCQAIIKKAASKRLGEKYGVAWLPETGAKYQLQFSIMNDRVQLYLDTSGPGLHKRGYRANANEAPLRETLAAATSSCRLHSSQNMGYMSSGVIGFIVMGLRSGMGLFTISACMLYHCVGSSLSLSKNFFCLLIFTLFLIPVAGIAHVHHRLPCLLASACCVAWADVMA